jgi:hypothetical protein
MLWGWHPVAVGIALSTVVSISHRLLPESTIAASIPMCEFGLRTAGTGSLLLAPPPESIRLSSITYALVSIQRTETTDSWRKRHNSQIYSNSMAAVGNSWDWLGSTVLTDQDSEP